MSHPDGSVSVAFFLPKTALRPLLAGGVLVARVLAGCVDEITVAGKAITWKQLTKQPVNDLAGGFALTTRVA